MLLNNKEHIKCFGTFEKHKKNILTYNVQTPIKMEHNVLKLNIKIAFCFSWHMREIICK